MGGERMGGIGFRRHYVGFLRRADMPVRVLSLRPHRVGKHGKREQNRGEADNAQFHGIALGIHATIIGISPDRALATVLAGRWPLTQRCGG
jgi:hypothetical protein